MIWIIWLGIVLVSLLALARLRLPMLAWTITAVVGAALLSRFGLVPAALGIILWPLLGVMVLMNITPLRRLLISNPLLKRVRKILPPMSETERVAIDAGTVGWEAELFGGNPQWNKLLAVPAPKLSEEEQAFIDGPVETLCQMVDDWKINNELKDLPPEIWQFIKDNQFFGMIISKEYGGLGFSALGHSNVIIKLASRSGTTAVTVMVPNSLGPAELLYHYGTQAQKDYYLPRLAKGEEIPCFALTGPSAGSDASSMPDTGIVCKGEYQGKQVLGFRTNWEKRYITLGPVSTLLGLAFKAYDPNGLLGDKKNLGITCALVPTDTSGVEIGNRHIATGMMFQNGPNSGKDVFIPLEWIIGGAEGVGQGWRMLMESLSVGRGISLPAMGASAGKFTTHITGAYARVRRQFNMPIGKFEGIEEPLARIGGLTYMMDAGRILTAAMIDAGEKPSVVSAILKYFNTEGMRQVINDAMDIHGGRGICMGPNNYLANVYQGIPIGITVEGANILTRSLIIFGQGAIRCHPYLLKEMRAAGSNEKTAVADFDAALYKHLGYSFTNAVRAFVFGLTRSKLVETPVNGLVSKYYQRLTRLSSGFAFLADLTLLFLGGELKRKEKLSGRFADALMHLYICSAVLKRFEDTGRPAEDLPLLEWSAKYCLFKVQNSLDEIMRNFPSLGLGMVLRFIIFPLGRRFRYPNDRLGHKVTKLLIEPSASRDRLTMGIFLSNDASDSVGCVEFALNKVMQVEPIEKRLRVAGEKQPDEQSYDVWLDDLKNRNLIDAAEKTLMQETSVAIRKAIMVDDFSQQEVAGLGADPSKGVAVKKATPSPKVKSKTAAKNKSKQSEKEV